MTFEEAILSIMREAHGEEPTGGPLDETQSSDPVVDDTAGAIVNALVMALEEDDVVGDNAFEMMMGSVPDENRLAKIRLEDVEATAELVIQAVYRDPELHSKLKEIAMSMIESAAGAARS